MVSARVSALALPFLLATSACASAPKVASAPEPVMAAAPEPAAPARDESAPARYQRAKAARARRGAIDVQMYVLDQALREVSAERAQRLTTRRADLLQEANWTLEEEIQELTEIADKPAEPGVDMPQVLLELARAFEDAGLTTEAAVRYHMLLSNHPQSPLSTQAHLGLASRAFADERLEDVVKHCEAVLAAAGNEGRIEALYLESWSLRGLAEEGKREAGLKAEEMLSSVTKMEPRSAREEQIIEAAKREIGGVKKGRDKLSL